MGHEEEHTTKRRDLLAGAAAMAAAAAGGAACGPAGPPAAPARASAPPAEPGAAALVSARRPLGRTGVEVEPVSLGGEGILRTTGRSADAVAVILEALRLGVRYCDTAPAYQQSQDYYGEALRSAGPAARRQIFLASKTHARDRDGALRLLDDSLRRLGTDHLDLWQLHDLRDENELDQIFGPGGAIEAVEAARSDGRVRFVGITGHHRPDILVETMRRYPVDSVLCAINPADPARAPFITTVVAEARRRGIGVVGMKVMAAGQLLADRAASPAELIRYAASIADTVIIGCRSPAEVQQNFAARAGFVPLDEAERRALEARVASRAHRYDSFKA